MDTDTHNTCIHTHAHTKQAVGTLTFCPGNGSGCFWRFWAPTAPYGQCVFVCVCECVRGQKVRGRGLRMGVGGQWAGRWQVCPYNAANSNLVYEHQTVHNTYINIHGAAQHLKTRSVQVTESIKCMDSKSTRSLQYLRLLAISHSQVEGYCRQIVKLLNKLSK